MLEAKEQKNIIDSQKDSSEIDCVKDLLNQIGHSSMIFRTYPRTNQIYLKSVQNLSQKFAEYFEQDEELLLSVEQYDILFNDQKVYSETNPSRSMALKLYRDGVRRLRFLRGLKDSEIVNFVEILSMQFNSDNLEDDIVTVLWEKDFSHIKYTIIEETFADQEKVSDGEGDGSSEAINKNEDEVETSPIIKQEYKSISAELHDISYEIKKFIITLENQALKELQKKMQYLAQNNDFLHVALVLFDIITTEMDPELTQIGVGLLGNLLRASLIKGHLMSAMKILIRITSLRVPNLGLTDQERERINQELSNLSDSVVLQQLTFIINKNKPEYDKWLHNFLLIWGKEAIDSAIFLASQTCHNKTIVELLYKMGCKHLDIFVHKLKDQDPKSVVLILKIISEIGDSSIENSLKDCIQNPHLEVKIEAIRTLKKLRGENAFNLLKSAVNDENLQVRCETVLAMASIGGANVVEFLKSSIFDKTFIDKSIEEKRAILFALAQSSGKDGELILHDILNSKRWFRSKRHNETRSCSAYALGMIGSSNACKILEEFIDDDSQRVKAACQTALARLKSKTMECIEQ